MFKLSGVYFIVILRLFFITYIFTTPLFGKLHKILTLSCSNGKRLTLGGMAEWFKAAVLKTVVRKYRGFESYFLRQTWRGDREADGVRLLSECGG